MIWIRIRLFTWRIHLFKGRIQDTDPFIYRKVHDLDPLIYMTDSGFGSNYLQDDTGSGAVNLNDVYRIWILFTWRIQDTDLFINRTDPGPGSVNIQVGSRIRIYLIIGRIQDLDLFIYMTDPGSGSEATSKWNGINVWFKLKIETFTILSVFFFTWYVY